MAIHTCVLSVGSRGDGGGVCIKKNAETYWPANLARKCQAPSSARDPVSREHSLEGGKGNHLFMSSGLQMHGQIYTNI